ncbi:hypothetical protein JAO73_14900 [Hymenobacter sp. BT523]|uniref:hypothetical protein n=1 Tax=Hymenobacter sp. BT523 TaxID=2795725 RepID=UPI0018EC8E1E|nr:hypothetical protein [Hymenobacter sp. BT523]MBJ6110310.1 hypothetical protein [Hymenobacter sp. BT523]
MQYHTGKLLLVWLGGIVAILVVAAMGLNTGLAAANSIVRTIWFLAIVIGGMYGLFRVGKSISAEPTLVVIDGNGLAVLNQKTGETRLMRFSEIAAYRFTDFNNAEQFRVTSTDGTKLKIAINTKLSNGQSICRIVEAFEAELGVYQIQAGEIRPTLREKTFFEKPISTAVMALLFIGLAWLLWSVFTSAKPVKWGSLFLVCGNVLIYFSAWLAASGKRKGG